MQVSSTPLNRSNSRTITEIINISNITIWQGVISSKTHIWGRRSIPEAKMTSSCQRLFLQLRKGTPESKAAADPLCAICLDQKDIFGYRLIWSE
jgi:hypothetical protein